MCEIDWCRKENVHYNCGGCFTQYEVSCVVKEDNWTDDLWMWLQWSELERSFLCMKFKHLSTSGNEYHKILIHSLNVVDWWGSWILEIPNLSLVICLFDLWHTSLFIYILNYVWAKIIKKHWNFEKKHTKKENRASKFDKINSKNEREQIITPFSFY